MVSGISNVNSVNNINYQPSIKSNDSAISTESLDNFDNEDSAIISAQAKMLNELDKYNSGQDNEVDLAVTRITAETQVKAEADVIKTKKQMMDSILTI